ncbi:hypothetical protein HDV05_007349 [Chytridiales sp. JEL 0842]|nr:hypothetical protein HDV05_007349 [Chytridiales sp. JEL 0842]
MSSKKPLSQQPQPYTPSSLLDLKTHLMEMVDGSFSLALLKASFARQSSEQVQQAINEAAKALSSGLLPPWSKRAGVELDGFLVFDCEYGPSNESGRLPTAEELGAVYLDSVVVDGGSVPTAPVHDDSRESSTKEDGIVGESKEEKRRRDEDREHEVALMLLAMGNDFKAEPPLSPVDSGKSFGSRTDDGGTSSEETERTFRRKEVKHVRQSSEPPSTTSLCTNPCLPFMVQLKQDLSTCKGKFKMFLDLLVEFKRDRMSNRSTVMSIFLLLSNTHKHIIDRFCKLVVPGVTLPQWTTWTASNAVNVLAPFEPNGAHAASSIRTSTASAQRKPGAGLTIVTRNRRGGGANSPASAPATRAPLLPTPTKSELENEFSDGNGDISSSRSNTRRRFERFVSEGPASAPVWDSTSRRSAFELPIPRSRPPSGRSVTLRRSGSLNQRINSDSQQQAHVQAAAPPPRNASAPNAFTSTSAKRGLQLPSAPPVLLRQSLRNASTSSSRAPSVVSSLSACSTASNSSNSSAANSPKTAPKALRNSSSTSSSNMSLTSAKQNIKNLNADSKKPQSASTTRRQQQQSIIKRPIPVVPLVPPPPPPSGTVMPKHHFQNLNYIMNALQQHQSAWCFLSPSDELSSPLHPSTTTSSKPTPHPLETTSSSSDSETSDSDDPSLLKSLISTCPMSLSTLSHRLLTHRYPTPQHFKSDFESMLTLTKLHVARQVALRAVEGGKEEDEDEEEEKWEGWVGKESVEGRVWVAAERLGKYFLNEWCHFFPELLERGGRRRAAVAGAVGDGKEDGNRGKARDEKGVEVIEGRKRRRLG